PDVMIDDGGPDAASLAALEALERKILSEIAAEFKKGTAKKAHDTHKGGDAPVPTHEPHEAGHGAKAAKGKAHEADKKHEEEKKKHEAEKKKQEEAKKKH